MRETMTLSEGKTYYLRENRTGEESLTLPVSV